jgi:hypothetical protein
MEYAVGVILAAGVGVFGTLVGLDKERSFYATVMLVIACLYMLFAAIGNSTEALAAEAVPMLLFSAAAVYGFKRSAWIVAAALALHGVFDLIHPHVIANPGVPAWWPGFCGSYDVVAAAYLSFLLVARRANPQR